MKRIVDLCLPIEEHWRYGIKFSQPRSHAKGDPWQCTAYNLESHWFTHIDAPLHHDPKGDTLSAYPIQDWCMGEALILDLSGIKDNEGITSDTLQAAAKGHNKHFDYLILRTDRARKVSWKKPEFWDNSPYVTDDGGEWIRDYHPKVAGYDFPQDYDIRKIRTAKNLKEEIHQPVHDHVLSEGKILQIEYLYNLWSIGAPTCTIVALPLPIPDIDGTQVRVIAIVEK
ncbi:MAG: cyclase family protein [Spirochaetales bacterium]|jgi:kynurenine formamidase|nr:cyclase family protein [Spirochaetales bacterium]